MIQKLSKHLNYRITVMLLGNLLSIVINILIVKVLTNKLSTSSFGLYSLLTSLATFPQLVLYAPIASAIFPFIKQKKESNLYISFQKDIFDLLYFTAATFSILMLVMGIPLIIFKIIPAQYVYLAFFCFIFSTTLSFLTTLDTFSLANSKINQYTIFPVLNLLLKLITLVMMYKLNYDVVDIILVFSAVHFVFCFIEYHFLRKAKVLSAGVLALRIRKIFDIKSISKNQILKYGLNFFLWGFFNWAQSFLDKYILNTYLGPDPVGVYSVYYQYGFFPFTIFSAIISQYITPIFFSKIGDYNQITTFIKRLIKYCLIVLVILCVVFYVLAYSLAPFFIKLLTNENYLVYIKWFPIIVIAGIFYGLGQIITIPLLNSDFVKMMRYPKIGTTVLAVILFIVLIPIYHVLGIMLALLISNVFYFIFLLVINYKYFRFIEDKKT